jgi:hypothetical protein
MNWGRLLLSALGAFVAYFAIGGAAFSAGPLRAEFSKYQAVYRPQNEMMSVMPAGMIAMFVAMVVMAALYAQIYRGAAGIADGARFGALIGLFAVCAFVIHNHVNLNIGLGLTVGQAIAYFVEWTVCGVVIALIYR